jgi:hypothetical protein
MQQTPFIDLFKSALHVSGDKLAHRQQHFLIAQQDATTPFIDLFKSALHVSGDKLVHRQ